MTGAVLAALRARLPGLSMVVETTLPEPIVRARIPGPLTVVAETEDFGLAMVNSNRIDVQASAARYRALHADWDGVVARAAVRMAAHKPDLVFSNAGYIALAAAARLGIPSVVLAPLTWGHIYRHYFADRPEAPGILATMEQAYGSARAVLVPDAAMPMDDLPNRIGIGPVGVPGRDRRAEVCRALGLDEGARLALVTFGGVNSGLDLAGWPRGTGWHWLTKGGVAAGHPDAIDMDRVPDLPFSDILASVDAVVTKLGYGMTTECGFAGRPTLYLPRGDDWPEEPHLRGWLERHAPLRAVDAARLRSGDILDDLEAVLRQPPPGPPARPTGTEEGARLVATMLGGG
ncbi:hypothetical protein SAMN05421720_101225 [Rhodospira trueperi]|uniref:UDP:flavonoid glycosyltransferase YjiC, YdhE family n=2 Tax=Rhodospira trueperi TaxID=69960 RepID=A0A1G6WNW4_9PROT|nr:hypothetical protein SAMN05421720_101225 [Rhodospira trueperi]